MPPRAPKAPAPTVEVVAPALALDSTRPLADRIAAVKGDGPDLQRQAKAAGWPSGISPEVSWALKRLERWDKGDERPVRVVVLAGKRCLASVDESLPDGAVVRARRAGGSR